MSRHDVHAFRFRSRKTAIAKTRKAVERSAARLVAKEAAGLAKRGQSARREEARS